MTITTVSSLSSLVSTVANASTNDIVQLDDGTYNNGSTISLTTSASKVFVRAKNSHRAIITGSPISFSSPGIHFLNFDLQFNLSSGNYSVINTGANNCRISHCKIAFGNGTGSQHWIIVKANNCMVDHNDISGKTTDGNMILIGSGSTIATDAKILANYIHDHTAGGESIRLGASDVAQVDFRAEIGFNRLENCMADTETITVKSSNNYIHDNYMKDCYSLSQRHGHNNRYWDNVLVNAGLRLNGYGHTVYRNQVIEDSHSQLIGHLSILNGDQEDDDGTAGQVVPSHAHYARTKNCVIEHNIFAGKNATNNAIVYLGYDTSHTFYPVDNTFSENIVTATTGTIGTQSGSTSSVYNVPPPGSGSSSLNSASSVRYGIEVNGTTSVLRNATILAFAPRLKQVTSPSGNVTATVRRASDDAIVATFNEVVDATTLSTTQFNTVTFTLPDPYVLQNGDKILVEYSGPAGIQIELFTTDQFDGSLTRRTRYQSGVYSASNTTDICGTMAGAPAGAIWYNQNMIGNILWNTGTATLGTMPGTQVDPLLTQNADKTYSFTASSPLKWSQYGKVIPTTEVGTIRSFV